MSSVPLLLSLAARAHDPSADSAYEPFVHDGVLAGAWTTAGLLQSEGSIWLEVCDAALPGLTDVWLAPDGRFLRAGSSGLEESTDGGCSFAARADVPLAIGLTDLGSTLAATTVDPLVGVFLSADDGASFAAAAPFPRELSVVSVGADAEGSLWVTADSTTGPALVVSTDGGASWTEDAGPPAHAAVELTAHGIGPNGGVLVTSGTLLAYTVVWESSPSGWVELATLPLDVRNVACIGSTCLASLAELALLRWDASAGASDSASLVLDGPVGCLSQAEDGTVWGCNAAGAIALFAATTDGFRFTQALPGEFIAPRICPAGTPGALACVVPPPPVDTGGGGGTNDPGTPPPLDVDGGCCATAGVPPTAWVLPVLLAAAKLRRTRRSLARPALRP